MAAIIKPKSGIINLGGMVLDLNGGGGGGADVSGIITAVNSLRPNTLSADASASAIATAITSNLYPLTHEKRRTFTFTPSVAVGDIPVCFGSCDFTDLYPSGNLILASMMGTSTPVSKPRIALINSLSYYTDGSAMTFAASNFDSICPGLSGLILSGEELYLYPTFNDSMSSDMGYMTSSPVSIVPGQVCTIAIYLRYYFPNILYAGIDVNGENVAYNYDFFAYSSGLTNELAGTPNSVIWNQCVAPSYANDSNYDTSRTGTAINVTYTDTEA